MSGPIDPFRDMREDKRREWLERLLTSVDALEEVIRARIGVDPNDYYWDEGMGGCSLEVARQTREQAHDPSLQEQPAALVRELQRAFWAVVRLNSVVAMSAHVFPELLYEPAYEASEWIIDQIHQRYSRASVSGFYHYAVDLLFDTTQHPRLGKNWMACSEGNHFQGHPQHREGDPCLIDSGRLRRITWTDVMGEPVTE